MNEELNHNIMKKSIITKAFFVALLMSCFVFESQAQSLLITKDSDKEIIRLSIKNYAEKLQLLARQSCLFDPDAFAQEWIVVEVDSICAVMDSEPFLFEKQMAQIYLMQSRIVFSMCYTKGVTYIAATEKVKEDGTLDMEIFKPFHSVMNLYDQFEKSGYTDYEALTQMDALSTSCINNLYEMFNLGLDEPLIPEKPEIKEYFDNCIKSIENCGYAPMEQYKLASTLGNSQFFILWTQFIYSVFSVDKSTVWHVFEVTWPIADTFDKYSSPILKSIEKGNCPKLVKDSKYIKQLKKTLPEKATLVDFLVEGIVTYLGSNPE